MPRTTPSDEAPPPHKAHELFLRYSALALAIVLILSSLTLRADPKSHPSIAAAVHGTLSGFLPFPETTLWAGAAPPETIEHRPSRVSPPALASAALVSPALVSSANISPALISPALMSAALAPANTQSDSSAPDRAIDGATDSALNVPDTLGGRAPSPRYPAEAESPGPSSLLALHTPPPMRFDGD